MGADSESRPLERAVGLRDDVRLDQGRCCDSCKSSGIACQEHSFIACLMIDEYVGNSLVQPRGLVIFAVAGQLPSENIQ